MRLRGRLQPPSWTPSSLMTGDVRVMVTCILGSEQEVRMMAASWTEPFTSYFSGVTTCRTATTRLRIRHSYACEQQQFSQSAGDNVLRVGPRRYERTVPELKEATFDFCSGSAVEFLPEQLVQLPLNTRGTDLRTYSWFCLWFAPTHEDETH